ncbi:hypothetical protein CYMTET_52881 [Cymbomonas tetramitiformis]|uniref:Uncharacterized protein n=1 Tax=Cymbomonas tetramitiformis TaxID=36881 RepID=A0AAE0BJ74_9CHLO|nr:hypothetical protein CYMTET_52881 [Cymbomonas tetramitiformis]
MGNARSRAQKDRLPLLKEVSSSVPKLTQDPLLENAVVHYLGERRVGFSATDVGTRGVFLVTKLRRLFWGIAHSDYFCGRFSDSFTLPGSSKLPTTVSTDVDVQVGSGVVVEGNVVSSQNSTVVREGMHKLFGFRLSSGEVKSKKIRPVVTVELLQAALEIASEILMLPWVKEYPLLMEDMQKTHTVLTAHLERMKRDAKAHTNRRQSGESTRTRYGDNWELMEYASKLTSEDLRVEYRQLQAALDNVGDYEALPALNDFLPVAGSSRNKTYYFVKQLSLRQPIEVYKYDPRNTALVLYVWKVPGSAEDRSTRHSIKVVDWCRTQIVQYSTAAQRKHFSTLFSPLLVSVQ